MKKIIKCVNCNSTRVIKKGKRKCKLREVQLFKCKKCGKSFGLEKLVNKTYPAKAVINAISLYNQGFSLEKCAELISSRYKLNISKSNLHNWLKEFKGVYSYYRIRDRINLKPRELVFSKVFSHKQVYKFRCHKGKIDLFVNEYFSGLKNYLIEMDCDDELFMNSNRGSQLNFNFSVKIDRKYNYACKLAELALKIAKNNKERHEVIQKFMLMNDTVTIATEVPVYLYKNELNGFNIFKDVDGDVTGHIDVLQLKFGTIYVLDYKPEAEKEKKVVSQLFIYAFALSKRTGIWLRNFRCAWFDDKDYFEFNPNEIILNNGEVDERMYVSDERKRWESTRKKGVELSERG